MVFRSKMWIFCCSRTAARRWFIFTPWILELKWSWQMLHLSLVFHMVSSLLEDDGASAEEHPTRASREVRNSISTRDTGPQASSCSKVKFSVLKILKPDHVPTARQVWSWLKPR